MQKQYSDIVQCSYFQFYMIRFYQIEPNVKSEYRSLMTDTQYSIRWEAGIAPSEITVIWL